jgi:outer membrane immunogenic protein
MYALIENVTNTRSRNFGSLFETNEIPFMNYSSPKMVSVGPPTAFFAGMKWDYGNDPSTSSWIASANGMYEKDRDTEIKTKTPKKWGGLYAGLNAGYGWGATTGANTTAMGIADAWSNTINGDLTSEAEDDDPWGLSNTGAMAMANTGLAQVARNGFIGGGQFGYNYQDESDVVLGAEADIQGTTFSGAGSYANAVADSSHYVENGDNFNYSRNTIGGGSVTASLSWIGTFRARLGYTLTPNILAYGTGGLAYGAVRASSTHWTSAQTYEAENGAAESSTQSMIPGFSNYSGFRAGWTAGGGIEWMLRDNWSLRAEGLYYNLGSPSFAASPVAVTCSGVACAGAAAGSTLWASTPITKIQFDGVIVRGGVNYHFDWGKADTVVAKY